MNNIWAIATVVIKELYRRKDFYVLFILTVLLTALMASVNLFNEPNIIRYVKEICLLLIWVSLLVISVVTTARQVPAEKENRTIFPLLAKPVTRTELILGKFLGCWMASGIALVCFYLFFALLSGAKENYWPAANYFQAAALHWAMLGIVIAMTMCGSIVFAAPSSNSVIILVVSLSILLVGRHLNLVALQQGEPMGTILYAIYYVMPHLEFFDLRNRIIHHWPPVAWAVWSLALLYAAVYGAIFLTAACALFRRKALN